MNHLDLPERNFASNPFQIELVTVDEAGASIAGAVTASETSTVAELTGVGYNRTLVRLVLTASDVLFLETGELEGERSSATRHEFRNELPPRGDGGVKNEPGMTLTLKGGRPVRFRRPASQNTEEDGKIPMETGHGLDYTDALLMAVFVRSGIQWPPHLRAATLDEWMSPPQMHEAGERIRPRRDAFLRTFFLESRFAQNAGNVSILAAFPSGNPIVGAK